MNRLKITTAALALACLYACVSPQTRRSNGLSADLQAADMLIARRHYARAAARLQRNLAQSAKKKNHPNETAALHLKLAEAYILLENAKAAEDAYRKAIRALPKNHSPMRIQALSSLGLLLQSQNRLQEALPLYEQAHSLARARYGAGDPRALTHLRDLAALHRAAKDAPREEAALRKVLETAKTSPSRGAYIDALEDLAVFLQTRGRDAQALPLYAAAVEQIEKSGLQDRQAARLRAAYAELKRRLDSPQP